MSKIEKALAKARQERGTPAAGGALLGSSSSATQSTALSVARDWHPETIARMALSETGALSSAELAQRGIIDQAQAEHPVVAVFRELRTRVTQQAAGRNCVILVSAVHRGGGASFVAQNLGAAFAFDARKTALLIDCNLRNPSVHSTWPNGSRLGLTDYLSDPDVELSDIIHPVGIPRYRMIGAGVQCDSSSEYFASPRMAEMLDTMRERYLDRYIILDGPPMSETADVRLLSGIADYVVLVARYARTWLRQIDASIGAVDDKKLLGIVFNDAPYSSGML